mgnify:FL=1
MNRTLLFAFPALREPPFRCKTAAQCDQPSPASSLCEPACGSSAWPFSPRYRAAYRRQERLYAQAAAPERSKRSGTAENDRCSCTVWPSSSRKMGHIFVSLSFMRTEAFFTPPGRFACPAFGHSRPASAIAGVKERKEV